MPVEIKQRQAFGAINGNRAVPSAQARQMPIKPGMVHATKQIQPRMAPRYVPKDMPVPKDEPPQPMRTSAPAQPMRMSAPAQRAYSTQSSANSDGSASRTISMKEIGMTKTICVREKGTFFVGPVTAQKGSFELQDVKAKVQIQPPTPLHLIHQRSMQPAARANPLPDDAKQAKMVEQWLANQRPPHAENDDARSTYSASSSTADIKSVYDFAVTNVGATRTRTFEQMPAPGSFMHGGPGEGPGLVC
jgi:hypothetical protein